MPKYLAELGLGILLLWNTNAAGSVLETGAGAAAGIGCPAAISVGTGPLFSRTTFAVGGHQIPLPIGVPANSFAKFLRPLLEESPQGKIEAVVIFGSRTHLAYGYPPDFTSDLDLLFISSEKPSDRVRRAWFDAFLPLITQDIPLQILQTHEALGSLLDSRTFNHTPDEATERSQFAQAHRPSRGEWRARFNELRIRALPDSEETKTRLRGPAPVEGVALENIFVGKQAIVLLFNPATARAGEIGLRARGYGEVFDLSVAP